MMRTTMRRDGLGFAKPLTFMRMTETDSMPRRDLMEFLATITALIGAIATLVAVAIYTGVEVAAAVSALL
jgi:hypothetical protein